MTEPWEWEETDLIALVQNEASESLTLDFKECAALDKTDGKKRDVSKDISSFANSAGGTVVYGVVEDKGRYVAKDLDDGYDPAVISQDWLDQVINSTIQPRISGVRIKAVPLATRSPGKVAYVVQIPQSTTAHQASDKRYYKRFNFQSVPMEDYEVRDVMNRVVAPNLSLEITFNNNRKATLVLRPDGKFLVLPDLLVRLRNEVTAGPAEYLQVHVFVSKLLQINSGASIPSDTFVSLPENTYLEYVLREVRINRDELPIYSGERRSADILQLKIPMSSSRPHRLELPFILWRIRTNGAKPAHGAVLFDQVRSDTWDCRPVGLDHLPPGSVQFDGELAP